MRAPWVPIAALVLAGCVAQPAPPPATGGSGTGALAADCEPPFAPTEHGVCALFLDPTGIREGDHEAHLAAHPTEPRTLLLTWRSGTFAAPRVVGALTRDGGHTWTMRELRDPSLDGNPLTAQRRNFDSIAAFSPAGDAYVHYGETIWTQDNRERTFAALTLAVTRDGAAWEHRRHHTMPGGVDAPDFMDLAVAPDTGHLAVVSQNEVYEGHVCSLRVPCGAPTGIWLMRSQDGGASWETQRALLPTHPPTGVGAPRVAAAPGGRVLVTTLTYDELATPPQLGGLALLSTDGGATFAAPQVTYVAEEGDLPLADPVAMWTAPDGTPQAALLFSGARGLVHVASPDGGASWQEPVRFDALPEGSVPGWGMAGAAPDGTLVFLQRYGAEDRFGALLYRGKGGAWDTLTLTDAPGIEGRYLGAGDDYGGLAVAADGAVWAAWSDLRTDPPRIAVVRVPGPAG